MSASDTVRSRRSDFAGWLNPAGQQNLAEDLLCAA
jgi:hypothetical protein